MAETEQLALPFDEPIEEPTPRTLREILFDGLNAFAWYFAEERWDEAEASALLAFGAWRSMLEQAGERG